MEANRQEVGRNARVLPIIKRLLLWLFLYFTLVPLASHNPSHPLHISWTIEISLPRERSLSLWCPFYIISRWGAHSTEQYESFVHLFLTNACSLAGSLELPCRGIGYAMDGNILLFSIPLRFLGDGQYSFLTCK
jgi:hypothetical protein